MHSLSQSIRMKGSAGEPIPIPFKSLAALEAEIRRGELSVVAAGAGTGKSLLALNTAIQANVPTIYWSADSNAATQLTRATAMISGEDVREIKKALREDKFSAYEKALAERWWIRFNYSAAPSPGDMETDLETYREIYGIYPHFAVVDNISNVEAGAGDTMDQYTLGLEGMCKFLNEMSRETQAHVMAMHHTVGEYADGLKPIPLSGLKGKIGAVPATVWTLHRDEDTNMESRVIHVSPVKNREGFADSSGNTFATLELNSRTLLLKDQEYSYV